MQKQKLFNAIGMCFKSNNIYFGQKLLDKISTKKINLLILPVDMGSAQKKKLSNKAKSNNVEIIDSDLTVKEISNACGKNISAIGIVDRNFIKLIKSLINSI